MTSARKVRSNRLNSRKSTGPRSAAGKTLASRNAVKHGLAALRPETIPSAAIAPFVANLCGKDADPRLVDAAAAVARQSVILRAIVDQQNALVERLRDPQAIALAKPDNTLERATAEAMRAWIAGWEIDARLPELMEKYKNEMPSPLPWKDGTPDWLKDTDDLVPIRFKALLEETAAEDYAAAKELAHKRITEEERDDHQALMEALPDLLRLERYYARTWSRYNCAVCMFTAVKSDLEQEKAADMERSKQLPSSGGEVGVAHEKPANEKL